MKTNRKSMRKFSGAVLTAAVLAAGLCYSCGPREDVLQENGFEAETVSWEEVSQETEERQPYFVHVCGQVENPGVYELEPGSRVYEAIEMAGGFGSEAAGWYLNLAQEITDGMKIQVPTRQEAAGMEAGDFSGSTQQGSQKVNLNTASSEQLMTLTGIGESRAADIIRYREEHGPFRRIEDIMNVSGIKEGAFEKIKDSITV